MDTSNLEKSQKMIARLIECAAENGIKESMIQFSDLGLDSSYEEYFYPCLEWLEREGIVRTKAHHRTMGGAASGSIQNLVLTSVGQSLLGMKVSVGDKEETLAETVEKVSKGDQSYSKFGDFLGGAIGGPIKSLGAG
ncbi:MAG: hypothetical protein ACP5EN_13510 [Rhodovulum sp.]